MNNKTNHINTDGMLDGCLEELCKLSLVKEICRRVDFGQVVITVHDGKAVEVNVNRKIRPKP